jgi:hypothetical protein
MLASGEASAAALARSRTMEALVLKRSSHHSISIYDPTLRDLDDPYRHGSCRACEEHRRG